MAFSSRPARDAWRHDGAARLAARPAALLGSPAAARTALVCVDAGGAESEALCAGSELVIAAYNGPRCHVLAGPAPAVHDLAKRLAEDGIPARLIDSPLALYSPRDGRPGGALAQRAAGHPVPATRPPADLHDHGVRGDRGR